MLRHSFCMLIKTIALTNTLAMKFCEIPLSGIISSFFTFCFPPQSSKSILQTLKSTDVESVNWSVSCSLINWLFVAIFLKFTGSLSDPGNISGLAHFCEHMLFLGTKKYPKENEYSQFLSEHAGSSNAFTSGEHTNYYFDVSHEHLQGALDRYCPIHVIHFVLY